MSNLILSIPSGFELFGHEFKLYGLISALSYFLGVVVACFLAKKRGMKSDDIITLACYVIPFAIVGARIGFVLFNLELYTNFWDIFKIWEGGLMFYGGLIGGALAALLYCRIHKKNFFKILDIVAPALVISQALGRWGNFFNQEAFGNFVDNPSLQWFPFAVYIDHCSQSSCLCPGSGWHHATFFYESLWNFLTFAILLYAINKKRKGIFNHNGIIASFYLVFYGIGRLFIEGIRTDSLYLGPIRASQLISIIAIIIGLTSILYLTIKSRKKEDSFSKIMKILKED